MSKESEALKALTALIDGRVKNLAIFTGTVKEEVNSNQKTCTVTPDDGDTDYKEVRLTAAINTTQTGVIPIPKKGSKVLCCKLTKDVAVVLHIEQLDKWLVKVENGGVVELNGDTLGGLAMTEKVAERIKRLEESLEALQTKFNAHTHMVRGTANPGGLAVTGTAAIVTSPSTEVLTPKTTQEFISNKNVKHG